MSPTDPRPYDIVPEGLSIRVRASPRASRSAIEGVAADADGRAVLRVRLAAPPVDGAANAELATLLAQALGVRKSEVRIAAGEAGRSKRVVAAGDGAALAKRLAALL